MIQFGWRRFSTGISRLLHETAIWFPPPGKLNGSGYTVLIQGACHTQFSPFGYKSISQGSFNEPGSQLPVSAWSLSIKSSIHIQPHHFIPDLLYYESHLTRLTHNYCHLLPSFHNFTSNLHSMKYIKYSSPTCDIYSTGLSQFRVQFLPYGSWSLLHQSVTS